MKTRSIILLIAFTLLSGTVSAQYDFEPLYFNAGCTNPAFGICSFGRGINNNGDVVGWGSSGVLGPEGSEVGFMMDKSGLVEKIEYPGAEKTRANGINELGEIVGEYKLPHSLHDAPHAFLRDKKGNYWNIDFPGSSASNVWGINNRGQVVGEYSMPGDGPGVAHAFLRNKDGSFVSFDFPSAMIPNGALLYTRFRDINEHGEIVGYYRVLGGAFPVELRGFLLDAKGNITPVEFPVGPPTNETFYLNLVHGITNSGVITGGWGFAAGFDEHGFVRDKKGAYMSLDVPGASVTEIYKSSDNGVLVGGFRDAVSGQSNAFLARRSSPLRSSPIEAKQGIAKW